MAIWHTRPDIWGLKELLTEAQVQAKPLWHRLLSKSLHSFSLLWFISTFIGPKIYSY